MGAFLGKPKTDKELVSGEGEDFKYGGCSMQGWRVEMEDAHTTEPRLTIEGNLFPSWSFFAIFDGHAGSCAAKMSSTRLIKTILKQNEFKNLKEESYDCEQLSRGIRAAFLEMDQILLDEMTEDRSGTTCTALLITKQHFFFINCGDSRGFLARAPVKDHPSSVVHFSTVDHKPTNPEERHRIMNAGGVVLTARINGSLAVSRALGDFDYKEDEKLDAVSQLVSPVPEVTYVTRSPDVDQFICLACDGIYDVFINDDLAMYINSQLCLRENPTDVASDVVDTSFHKGSKDNMSVLLLTFPAAPGGDAAIRQAASARERKLNDLVKKNLEIICDSHCGQRLQVTDMLVELEKIEEIFDLLPPGGAIHSQGNFVDSILQQKWPDNDNDNCS